MIHQFETNASRHVQNLIAQAALEAGLSVADLKVLEERIDPEGEPYGYCIQWPGVGEGYITFPDEFEEEDAAEDDLDEDVEPFRVELACYTSDYDEEDPWNAALEARSEDGEPFLVEWVDADTVPAELRERMEADLLPGVRVLERILEELQNL